MTTHPNRIYTPEEIAKAIKGLRLQSLPLTAAAADIIELLASKGSTQKSDGDVNSEFFDDGDLFWKQDDGEACFTSMDEFVQSEVDECDIENGDVLTVLRAKYLPTVKVRVLIGSDGSVDYEFVSPDQDREVSP